MQNKVFITSLNLCVFILMSILNPAVYSGDHGEKTDYYKKCIIKKIKKCDSMFVLLSSSKSKNLKEYAMMAAQKASYLDNEKEILVKEMIEMGLEPKQYKVDLFLNSRFRESLQPKK